MQCSLRIALRKFHPTTQYQILAAVMLIPPLLIGCAKAGPEATPVPPTAVSPTAAPAPPTATTSPPTATPEPTAAATTIPLPAYSPIPSPAPVAGGLAEIGSGRIYYQVHGEGFPLVLIHDGLVSSVVWENQLAALARRYQVITYDRRGYGRSATSTERFSNVNDLYNLLQFLGVDAAIVIGSSAGGGLAIDFTLAHPDMVEALVLVGAVVTGYSYSSHFLDRNAANTTLESWIQDPYTIAPGNAAARQRLRELLLQYPNDLTGYGMYLLPEPSAIERLSEIQVYTLIIVGEADIPDVHAHAGAIEVGIPRARRVVIPDAGHLVYLEQPEKFNDTVIRFLSAYGP